MDQDKCCSRCREYRPPSAFGRNRRNKDGLSSYCKRCHREYRAGATGALHCAPRSVRDSHGKTCARCREHKPWDEFRRKQSAKDGRQSYCRTCAYAYERESEERHTEAIKARYAEKLAREVDHKATKMCRKCGQERPLLEFYAHRCTADGRANYCRACAKDYQREWRAKHPERVRRHNETKSADPVKRTRSALAARVWRLKLYGLTPESYDALLAAQGGVCAICGRAGSEWDVGRSLHVDHDHATNVVRGLLCHTCNVGLGSFADDIDWLARAITYLTDPPARQSPTGEAS